MTADKKYLQGIFICFMVIWIALLPAEVSAADRNFNQTANVKIAEAEDFTNTNQFIWIKYKAKNNGYVTITAKKTGKSSYASGTVCLFDSKKSSALSGEGAYNTASSASSNVTLSYGVKKGTVYYFRVKAQGAVSIKCKFTKVNESSGNSQSKAKAITKNKEIKGTIAAGDKTADWYKIKITNKQVLNLYYSGKTNEKIKFTFSGTYIHTAERYVTQGVETVQHTYSTERVQPGTYYVKVERFSKTSSGYYTLKWN